MTENLSAAKLSRHVPLDVRRELRKEVGFGCPVKGCDSPYLEYHHFDPAWHVDPHHDPRRMIALCSEHHAKADAWTVEQVRALKSSSSRSGNVVGRFEWMRREILAVVGGNLYYATPVILRVDGQNMVWFERDEDQHLLLNIRMTLPGEEPRTELVNNDWIIQGGPSDVESPPNGSKLVVRYDDHDYVHIRFQEWKRPRDLAEKFPLVRNLVDHLSFPLVTAEIHIELGRAGIRFDSKRPDGPGSAGTGNFFLGDAVAWDVDSPSIQGATVHGVVARYASILDLP
jgi:hypothetical protein